MKRAAIYARVSTEEQVGGYSAKTADRPRFQVMVADAKSQPRRFERIYVWKLDRFARSREDSVTYKALLRRAGIEVLSVKEPLGEPDSPASILLEGVLETVGEWYNADLKQKMSRARLRRVDLGLANGDPPFAYQRNPESAVGNPLPWVVVPSEAEIVRQLFEYVSGSYSMSQLADWVSEQGFLTRNKRKNGGRGWVVDPAPWTKETVKDLLRNPVYWGAVTYKDQVMGQGKHEPIVDEALFERCQEVIRSQRRRPKKWSRKHRFYPLAGLVRCVACGNKLAGTATGRHVYYRDVSAIRKLPCPHGGKGRVGAKDIERQLKVILESLPEGAQAHVVAMMAPPDIPAKERTARRQQLDARINAWALALKPGR